MWELEPPKMDGGFRRVPIGDYCGPILGCLAFMFVNCLESLKEDGSEKLTHFV